MDFRIKVITTARKMLLNIFQSTQGRKDILWIDFAQGLKHEMLGGSELRVGRKYLDVHGMSMVYTRAKYEEDNRVFLETLTDIRKYIFTEKVLKSYQVLSLATPRARTKISNTPQIPAIMNGSYGDYAVRNSTRDELGWKGWKPRGQRAPTGFWKEHLSTPGNRFIALDFNDAESTIARGIEIVVPRNVTPDEVALCQEWAKQTRQLYVKHGLENLSPESLDIRRDRGVMYTGQLSGVFHTEPFFVHDKAARGVIAQNGAEYAEILGRTLGQIKGATFIAPHETNTGGGGADAPLDNGSGAGLNERDFAKNFIIPHL